MIKTNGRIVLLYAVLFLICGGFLFGLFQKQILQHDELAQAAIDQSTSLSHQPAERGQIFAQDKDGKLYPLAVSNWTYQLLISPRQVKNKQALVASLKEDLPQINSDEIFAKINSDKLYIPPVAKGLDSDTANKINNKGYAGVFLLPELDRYYPEADKIAAQVLGFVGSDGTGKYGVESYYDNDLQGKSGSELTKRDSLGRLIDVLNNQDSQPGSDIVLSLDYNLQYAVENKLKEAITNFKADTGEVVIMDPKTGAIISAASQPTFDPNNYSKVDNAQDYLLSVASNTYEPGSVFKPLTMSAAINENLVEPDTVHTVGPSVTINGKEITNANKKVFGTETMTEVLQNSDNVQMAWVSGLLGKSKEYDYLQKYGVGKKTGIDITGEQSGILPKVDSWSDLLLATASFGQGVSTTLLQLASAYCVIANGGMTVQPHFAAKIVTDGVAKDVTEPPGQQIISSDTAAKLRTMLIAVVELGEGKRAKVDGLKVAGKTGTAQVPSPQGGYYSDRTIGTFVGMFPADNPKYVMAVRLDNPKTVNFAESSAAPTFGDIASWMANYYQLR